MCTFSHKFRTFHWMFLWFKWPYKPSGSFLLIHFPQTWCRCYMTDWQSLALRQQFRICVSLHWNTVQVWQRDMSSPNSGWFWCAVLRWKHFLNPLISTKNFHHPIWSLLRVCKCVCVCACSEVGSYMRASKGMNKGCLESNGNGVLMWVYRELDPQKERKRKSSLTWAPAVIWNCTPLTRNITKPLKSKTQELRMCVYVCDNKTTRLREKPIVYVCNGIQHTEYSIQYIADILYLKCFQQ